MKKEITIIVEGGVVQEINNIPEDITITLKDYDCDEEDCGEDDPVETDTDGNVYWKSVWEN